MLTISQQARDVVRQIPNQPGLPTSAGLRLSAGDRERNPIRVLIATKPRRGDKALDFEGARVYLDPDAVDRLQGRLIDVETLPDGRLQFRSLPADATRSPALPSESAA